MYPDNQELTIHHQSRTTVRNSDGVPAIAIAALLSIQSAPVPGMPLAA
jgi:hypothetical protein